ncbi:hypothetical protein J437_LFUL008369 [Ladona fulva]|uniref:Thioredoxin n=1 Tax=Ladona fulva TaxID=123851 RepID=A0A8K0KAC6_LADFU|nr:hypothetical protein J437_LFUL008369 [Ladona fulva]
MAHHVQNKEDLEAKLTEAGDNLVVIDFSATWCGPCRMIGPVFESMASEMQFSNVVFLKVDVDECDDIAAEYEISAMPTFVFLRKSQKVSTFSGANADKLRQTITSLL